MNSRMLRINLLFLIVGSLFVGACTTNSPLDIMSHSWEWQSTSRDSSEVNALCHALEDMEYTFDLFDVYDVSIRVFYPQNQEKTYYVYTSTSVRVITTIQRIYEQDFPITDAELSRLLPEARQLCQNMRYAAQELNLPEVDVSLVLLDPESGVSIQYNARIPKNCDTIDWRSVYTGSQSSREQFQHSICH